MNTFCVQSDHKEEGPILTHVSSSQLQSSGLAALQKPRATQREAPVRHRGDGGIRTGVKPEMDTR